jgi:hypothetical protein
MMLPIMLYEVVYCNINLHIAAKIFWCAGSLGGGLCPLAWSVRLPGEGYSYYREIEGAEMGMLWRA